MPKIIIYTKVPCPYCEYAKSLLTSLGYSYENIDLTHKIDELMALVAKTNHRTVPQIFIDDKFIGGFDNLQEYVKNGGLKSLK